MQIELFINQIMEMPCRTYFSFGPLTRHMEIGSLKPDKANRQLHLWLKKLKAWNWGKLWDITEEFSH